MSLPWKCDAPENANARLLSVTALYFPCFSCVLISDFSHINLNAC